MSNPYGAPASGYQPPKRGGAVALMIIGGISMILAPIVGVVVSAFNIFGALNLDQFSDQAIISNPGVTDMLEPGEWVVIAAAENEVSTACTVTNSAGQPVPTDTAYGVVKYITVTQPDTFNVSCDSGPSVLVVEKQIFDNLVGDGGKAIVVPAVIGFLGGGLGLAMLVAGIIWFIAAGRRAKNEGGYGPGGYGPGGYGGYPSQPGSYPTQGYQSTRDFPGQSTPNPYATPEQGGYQPRQYGQRPDEPPRYGERL